MHYAHVHVVGLTSVQNYKYTQLYLGCHISLPGLFVCLLFHSLLLGLASFLLSLLGRLAGLLFLLLKYLLQRT